MHVKSNHSRLITHCGRDRSPTVVAFGRTTFSFLPPQAQCKVCRLGMNPKLAPPHGRCASTEMILAVETALHGIARVFAC